MGHRAEKAAGLAGVGCLIEIVLPFPDKSLWPNGRPGHWAVVRRAFKKHKEWALYGVLEHNIRCPSGEAVEWSVIVHPKTKHPIDRDNALASLKAYQDGMAAALGMNDSWFGTPELTFGEPIKGGCIVIRLHL